MRDVLSLSLTDFKSRRRCVCKCVCVCVCVCVFLCVRVLIFIGFIVFTVFIGVLLSDVLLITNATIAHMRRHE